MKEDIYLLDYFASLVKCYRISILIGSTVFPTTEENRIVVLLTTWRPYSGKRDRVI